ncbi:hypothetical protein CAPTEDRAFT_188540 [Capitella teleta]|uniref:Uncharacterized protein n=1 Tax=Capitella teleta TaxID=283909 RepID=R7UHJ8_CAPTE|nr:hypothetical protein CAPTEDRAFT_190583 [Capitella teleta]ELU06019.1 hypothetical protein CAPTEDRAFT_188540 [Capitella teleta]|eukprot:ELT87017.1 hypothetical protein CAPTEDRAFT_190583 [Capitella teleta]
MEEESIADRDKGETNPEKCEKMPTDAKASDKPFVAGPVFRFVYSEAVMQAVDTKVKGKQSVPKEEGRHKSTMAGTQVNNLLKIDVQIPHIEDLLPQLCPDPEPEEETPRNNHFRDSFANREPWKK